MAESHIEEEVIALRYEKLGRHSATYLSPKDLAGRWRCSRTTAQRIAERAGLTRLYLGTGKNGIVRYIRLEVEAYEESRKFKA